jgi:hypothetical protein
MYCTTAFQYFEASFNILVYLFIRKSVVRDNSTIPDAGDPGGVVLM